MSQPHIPDDTIKSAKQFAGFAAELLDSEVQQAVQIIVAIQNKYKHRANTPANLEALRDEALSRLADIGILATVDPAPCFYGEPPILEIIGKVQGDALHKDGLDHERKSHEVRSAHSKGEYYLGERETPNRVTKAQKRDRNTRKK